MIESRATSMCPIVYVWSSPDGVGVSLVLIILGNNENINILLGGSNILS